MIESNGIENVEVEFLGSWWTTGEERVASDIIRRDLFSAAEALGAHTVKVCGEMGGRDVDRDLMAYAFWTLSEEAKNAGTRIALEAMPFSNFTTIEDGAAFVSEVGHSNGGLIVDVWHVNRGGSSLDTLRAAIDPGTLFAVELNDGRDPAPADLWSDTVNDRLLPGEGDWDLPGFVQLMRELGFDGPWGVEELSEHHRQLPLREALESAFAATQGVFAHLDH
jgi:sugar phosphate isomerase/epimerase